MQQPLLHINSETREYMLRLYWPFRCKHQSHRRKRSGAPFIRERIFYFAPGFDYYINEERSNPPTPRFNVRLTWDPPLLPGCLLAGGACEFTPFILYRNVYTKICKGKCRSALNRVSNTLAVFKTEGDARRRKGKLILGRVELPDE